MNTQRILIVDDNDVVRKTLMEFFDDLGHEVVTADRGEDAEQKFVPHTFDLVVFDLPITDLIMRDFSSIGALSKLIAKDKEVPFLLITGYQTIETTLEAIKDGAYDYVIKPLNMDDLRIKVERALTTRTLKTSLKRAYCIMLVLIIVLPILFMISIIFGLIWAI
jgi:DNA-binding NtrC family response regulator